MKQRGFKFYVRFVFFLCLTLIPSLAYLITMGVMLESMFSFGIFIGFIAALVISTQTVWNNYRINYETETREINDVSFWCKNPPAIIYEPIQILENLGFQRLGESDTQMPGLAERIVVWLFKSEDGSIVCEVIPLNTEMVPYMVGFSTAYDGPRAVETLYPLGENIRDDDYQFVGIGDSVEAAYHYHIRQVGRFTKKYGQAKSINSMEDYLKQDKIWRKNFAKRQLRPSMIRGLTQVSFWKLAVATMATGIFVYGGFPFYSYGYQEIPDSSISVFNLIALFGSLLLALAFAPRRRSIKTRKKKD